MADWFSEPFLSRTGLPRLLLACGVLLFASGVCAAPGKDSPSVTAIRFWSLGDVTRVAIEVSSDFTFKFDRLVAPERLFFDIQGARPDMAPKGIHVIPVNDALLTQIRVAETQPDVTRVVLDLAQTAAVTTSQLSSPNRLIIELRAKEHPSPPPAPSVTAAPPPPVPGTLSKPANVPVTPVAVASTPRESTALPVPSAPTPSFPAPTAARRGDRSLTRALGLKLGRVVLDAGHGGNDVGTHGPSGYLEKDLTLDVATRLGALVEERLGSEVFYTRSDDSYVGLEDRTKLANDRKADLFLSIHANSSPYRSAAGVETYVLNFTTSKTALELAARENASSGRSIHDLRDLVEQITLKDKIDESREFAAKLQTSLSSLSTRSNDAARNRGVKRAPFVVLIGAAMPSVLAEVGFLTNSTDEALLRKPEHRQRIAEALYKGIEAYVESLSRTDVARQN